MVNTVSVPNVATSPLGGPLKRRISAKKHLQSNQIICFLKSYWQRAPVWRSEWHAYNTLLFTEGEMTVQWDWADLIYLLFCRQQRNFSVSYQAKSTGHIFFLQFQGWQQKKYFFFFLMLKSIPRFSHLDVTNSSFVTLCQDHPLLIAPIYSIALRG